MPCLNVDHRRVGDGIVGRSRAISIWQRLIRSRSFTSAVVVSNPPISGHTVVGFGSAVFVSPEFATSELAKPQPGLNDRLMAGLDAQLPVVLSGSRLASTNANGTLDLIVLYANWIGGILDDEERSEIQNILSLNFLRAYSGYRLGTLLCEEIGEEQRAFRKATRVWRLVQEFTSDRALTCLTRQDALSLPGSVAAALFRYRTPTLSLRDEHKQLLRVAINGGTDLQVAQMLNISLAAVKKRWRSVWAAIMRRRPDLVPASPGELLSGSRGRQKKHIILAYLRDHPEELRPFENYE